MHLKNRLFLILIIFTIALTSAVMVGQPVSAQDPAMARGITRDFVNLRSGPGTNFETITIIDPEVTVDIVGRNEAATWIQVNVNGQSGWMSRSYVSLISGAIAALPVTDGGAPAPTPAPDTNNPTPPTPTTDTASTTTQTTAPVGGTTGVTTTLVNLRSAPTSTANIIAVVDAGVTVSIIGRNTNSRWLRVNANGQEGWMYRTLVRFDTKLIRSLPIVTDSGTGSTPATTSGTTNTTSSTGTGNRPTSTGGITVYPFGVGGTGNNPEVGDNDTDGRISQFLFTTDAIIYCRDFNGHTDTRTYQGGGIIVYLWQGPVTGVVFYATEAMINAAGIPSGQPTLIRAESGFSLFRVADGAFQMVGPNRGGGSFNISWYGCNPSPETE
jgi:uncharacterized protein YraI